MRIRRVILSALLALQSVSCVGACHDPDRGHAAVASPTAKTARPAAVASVALRDLHVTTGHVVEMPSGRLHVTDPKTRFVGTGAPRSAQMQLTYRGPTAKTTKLASGEMRRQLGLKLRAKNGCNVVYAMWRIEPENKLVVSVKRNEGESTHDECGAGGYEDIKAAKSSPIPRLAPGESHVMAARIDGARMRVDIDAQTVWEGELPKEAFSFDGPAGVRTDNVDVDLEFSTGG